MRKIMIVAAIMGGAFWLVLFSATPLLADCLDFSGYDSYLIEGDNKIFFYRGPTPFAVVILQTCKVLPGVDVRVTKAYMCDSDKIIINGEECGILSLDSLQ